MDKKTQEELQAMTDDALLARSKENSAAWHTAGEEEKTGLHDENVSINQILDSRRGETTAFDPDSGTWSPRQESAGAGDGSWIGGGKKSRVEPGSTGKFSYASAPDYVNKYQGKIDELTRDILGRAAFTYDPESDPIYQQYKESYTKNGKRAMEDTLGQVSARTGGLASSYAGSAAQQTYDNYMGALSDKIPELRQLAYQMYQDEGATQRANLEMLTALEQGDYNKYLTLLNQHNADRSFDYGVWSDQREHDYRLGRDAVSDEQWQKTYDRGVLESDRAFQYEQDMGKAALLAGVGNYSGYARLWGLTEEETAQLVDEYARQKQLTEDQAARELADYYAQYGDFSKLKGLNVDTSYLTKMQNYELGKLTGGQGNRKRSPVPLESEMPIEELPDDKVPTGGQGGNEGLNPSHFRAGMQSLAMALEQGRTSSAENYIGSVLDKLSEQQRQKLEELLGRYGLAME